jgi:hypothetical protein
MIWLRYELWEDHEGPSYRLASRAETDRLTTVRPEAILRHVFYAPSTAAAVAQFHALRNLGPYIPGDGVSEEAFSLAQLQAQLADFPGDTILSGQPTLTPAPSIVEPVAPVAETGLEPIVVPTPIDTVEAAPLAVVSEVAPDHDPRDLWPVTPDEIIEPRWSRRPTRKPNPFLGLLRVVLLLIVLAGVAVGLLIVTGTADGPTLLAKAKAVPAQIQAQLNPSHPAG